MKKVSAALCAVLSVFILSCTGSQKKLPAPVQGSGVLALSFDLRLHIVSGLNSASEIRYARAARVVKGKVDPDTSIATDVIQDNTAYFFGVEPGEYVFTDLTFKKDLGVLNSGRGQTAINVNVAKFDVVVLSGADVMKTAVKVSKGSLSYMGRLSILAEGYISDFIPGFKESESNVKKISINKGYSAYTFIADGTMGAQIEKVTRDEKDSELFRKRSRSFLGETEWKSLVAADASAAKVR